MSDYRSHTINRDSSLLAGLFKAILIMIAVIIAVKLGVFLLGTLLALTVSGIVLAVICAPFIFVAWLCWLMLRAILV